MENYIKFKQWDLVCQKQDYKSPLGAVHKDVRDMRPWTIIKVIPDAYYNARVGEIGCANEYVLDCYDDDGRRCRLYQYELVLWSEVKNEVIQALERELDTLKTL